MERRDKSKRRRGGEARRERGERERGWKDRREVHTFIMIDWMSRFTTARDGAERVWWKRVKTVVNALATNGSRAINPIWSSSNFSFYRLRLDYATFLLFCFCK